MTAAPVEGVRTAPLPRAFHAWLGAATLSTYGDSALYFALGWAASGISPALAGLVLTSITLPRTLLVLLGGAVGDRWGARRVMVAGDAVMLAVSLVLAAVVHADGVSRVLLLGTGLAVGLVDAFYLPATGSFPRLMVDDADLPRALALKGSFAQAVTLLGGPVSGVLVAAAGLAGAALVDAATFAVVLAVLLLVRLRHEVPPAAEPRRGVLADAGEGVRLVLADPLLRTVVGSVAVVAACLLPVPSLCVPLLVRGHAWGAASAGLLVGAAVGGALAVTLLVARRGRLGDPLGVAGIGLGVAATGVGLLALAPVLSVAVAGALVQGVGTGLYTSHVAPIVLGSAPRTHLARVQSVLVVVQAAPLVVANPSLGALAGLAGARTSTLACAGGALGAAVLLLRAAGRRTEVSSAG